MMSSNYYDGTTLLSMKDINGNTPELFLCTSNRRAGKTTYFYRLGGNRYKKKKQKMGVLFRFDYELDDCADKIFKDVGSLFFPDVTFSSKRRAHGKYHELFWNDEPCGYALALNNADQYKRMAHLFSDTSALYFDEFQSETNHYCVDEIKKFQSIHTSLARGQHQMVRYLPVYMMANPVTLINPYYVALGISERLNTDTKFLRGNGFVLEQGYLQAAEDAANTSGFNRAFASDDYQAFSNQGVYLNDSKAFIENPQGNSKYVGTIKYGGQHFSLREYADLGIIYCGDKADMSYPMKIAVTTDDHAVNYVMLKQNEYFIQLLRYYFDRGCFRFKNLQCKAALMKAISY